MRRENNVTDATPTTATAGARDPRALGIVSEMRAVRHKGGIYIHLSFGRVIDRLAARFAVTYLTLPFAERPPSTVHDYRLQAPNLEIVPQPFYASSLEALRHVVPITRAYATICRQADVLFIRGIVPYVCNLYALAWARRRHPCHWIVGNPVALLQTHRRAGRLRDTLSLCYALQDRLFTRCGRWLTQGAFLCNGDELGRIFASPRTHATVSSTITADEFSERADTCQGTAVQILFIGMPRPEKGLQYLFQALAQLRLGRPWQLTIVGAAGEFDAYRIELEQLANQLGIAGRIQWVGYVTYGPEMFRYLRAADLFVLPTLSEGTPRVLIEARANSVPIVASRVGGIPTSVQDGVDGLLVPPKDPGALAAAITRVVADPELRRALIRNGLATARRMTVDRFVELAVETLAS